jgi:F-type H+-transporting ATPase subunit b
VLIDWFTVIAQIINFLILVLLLRRFLYRPILNMMAERERKIAERLEQAEKQRETAAAEIETYRQKNADFDEEREAMIRQAQADVTDRRQGWLNEARNEVKETRTRWQKALTEEREAFLQTVRLQAGRQTYQVIRQALADLADAELEAQIVAVFVSRLASLPAKDAQPIHEALEGETAVLTLHSGFDLDDDQRQALLKGITTQFSNGHTLQFQTNPDLICGLELVAPGHKVAWSLSSYLDELEEALLDVLTGVEVTEAEAQPDA